MYFLVDTIVMPPRAGHRDQEAQRTLGAELKRIRLMRDKTLRGVASRTELSPGYLHKLEAGTVPLPSPHILYALAHELNADYRDLFIAAGYPLPDAPRSAGKARTTRSSRGSALARVLERERLSDDEAVELASYLRFIRQRRV
jgi:transcriptional regulator with XRE-family HTH domain